LAGQYAAPKQVLITFQFLSGINNIQHGTKLARFSHQLHTHRMHFKSTTSNQQITH